MASRGERGSTETCSPVPVVSSHQWRDVKDNYLAGWTQLPPQTQQTAKAKPIPQLQVPRHSQPCNARWQLKTTFLSVLQVSLGSKTIYCLIRRAFLFWHFFSHGIISAREKKPKQRRKLAQPRGIGFRAGTRVGASPVCAAGAQAG